MKMIAAGAAFPLDRRWRKTLPLFLIKINGPCLFAKDKGRNPDFSWDLNVIIKSPTKVGVTV